MTSLASILLFCTFVSLSNSACFFKLLNLEDIHCVDGYDNSKHPVGSTWTNGACIRCICSHGQMECCYMMGRPTVKTEGCIVKYDYKKCTFVIFHPEDPTIQCAYSAVGK